MYWTLPEKPSEHSSYYDHVTLSTILGVFKIEWKSWDDKPNYRVRIMSNYGNLYEDVYNGSDLDDAKDYVKIYIEQKIKGLESILKSNY